MRGWKDDGLVLGQAVDAHVKEAAYCQTQNGEDDYQEYFHGCLLWTYHRPEVNRWWGLFGVLDSPGRGPKTAYADLIIRASRTEH